MKNGWTSEIARLQSELDRLADMAVDFIGTEKELRSVACIEVAIDHAKWLRSELEQARRERDEWKATAGHEADGLESWKKVAEKAEAELAEVREKYDDLIMCVEKKYPGETRHETAKRYILDRERFSIGETQQAIRAGEGK